jgi:hypothetical protein
MVPHGPFAQNDPLTDTELDRLGTSSKIAIAREAGR